MVANPEAFSADEANRLGITLAQQGRLEEAVLSFQRALQIKPDFAQAYYNMAITLQDQGRLEEAVASYQGALRIHPGYVLAHYGLGTALGNLHKPIEAVACYRHALELDPELAGAHLEMGTIYQDQGLLAEAATSYQRALDLKPDFALAHFNLGNVWKDQGQLAAAVGCFERALACIPDFAEAYNNLGLALEGQEKEEEAVACFQKALAIKPDLGVAHHNLGRARQKQGKLAEAIAAFERARECQPNIAQFHSSLGHARAEQGNLVAALACHQRAIDLEPDNATAHNDLGGVLMGQDELNKALACFGRAIQLQPDNPAFHINLGQIFKKKGRMAEALACFEKAQALAPSDGLKIRAAFLLPAIPQSRADIQEWRGRFQMNLERLSREPLALTSPSDEVGATHFFLAYHGLNDRDLQAQMAALYVRACPALNYVAPHCQSSVGPRLPGRPLRIGFLSNYFHDHSVSRHFAGIIRHLTRPNFHVILLSFAGPADKLTQSVRDSADEVVTLSRHMKLETLHQLVAEQQLDLLHYTDIGMDPWSYFLAFARLAPVQSVTPGHPVTTGIPTIDYFISSTKMEPADAEEHFTERLVRLRHIPTYFMRPELSGPPMCRGDFGLKADVHLYMCPQALFKIHPDFDELATAILRADPKGRLLLMRAPEEDWTQSLTKRLQGSMGEVFDRVQFLPRHEYKYYLHLLTQMDVLLDTPHFSGGTTSLQALGLGVPIVTLPGRFTRGRVTYACYQDMGVEDCIAADGEDYVRIALGLANDPGRREEVRGKILAASHVLYENLDTVRELEQFFIKAVDQARAGLAKILPRMNTDEKRIVTR